MSDGHHFTSISLHGRGGANPGSLTVHSGGFSWKKQDGRKAVAVEKTDLLGLSWMKVPKSHELGIRTRDGLNYKLIGFRDQDIASLNAFFQSNFGITPEEKQLSVSGKNHGDIDLNGNNLTFLVGNKQAFEVSLADVSQTQVQGKNDVMLEFHVDDTTGANEKDSLMEISFHVSSTNTKYVGDENRTPAQVLREMINERTDTAPGGERPVVTLDGIGVLTPRGRYNIELHLSFLRLQGQANDFKMQYSSVVRVFWLPKVLSLATQSNQPHTFVVVTLDPPIRKGQTLYPHIVMQFDTDSIIDTTLSMSEELFNSKYADKLKQEYKGLVHETFVSVLRGLSGAKVTRPGSFRSHLKGFAVKSSLKAEDGTLYPLDKSFFFLPKPPTLILHDEIDYVEFERHAAGGSNMHYFDFLVRLKSEQEHLFRNIQRNEYHNLFKFVSEKGLKIMNLGLHDMTSDSAVAAALEGDLDDAVDPHLERIKNAVDESDEEDEDFVAEKDDDGSPSDDSGEEDSDASDSGGEKEESVRKKPRKEPPPPAKASSSKKQPKDGDGEGSKKKRKPKEKKDPNAPKKNMSAYLFFSNTERENYKKNHPEKSPAELMAALAEGWKKLTAEEKAPYEAKALADKKRYTDQMSDYKNPHSASRGSPGESGSS